MSIRRGSFKATYSAAWLICIFRISHTSTSCVAWTVDTPQTATSKFFPPFFPEQPTSKEKAQIYSSYWKTLIFLRSETESWKVWSLWSLRFRDPIRSLKTSCLIFHPFWDLRHNFSLFLLSHIQGGGINLDQRVVEVCIMYNTKHMLHMRKKVAEFYCFKKLRTF